jgi:phosphatidylserine decarboxylase
VASWAAAGAGVVAAQTVAQGPCSLAEHAYVRANRVVCPRPAEECVVAVAVAAAAAAGRIRCVIRGADAVQMGPEVR